MTASPPAPVKVSGSPGLTAGSRASPGGIGRAELVQTVEREDREKSPQRPLPPAPVSRADAAKESPVEGASNPAPPRPPPPVSSWPKVIDDYNEVSSDDEDRLVIAT